MSELFCEYDHENIAKANHKCDFCGKLMCSSCGYVESEIEYCSECWLLQLKAVNQEPLPMPNINP